MKLKNNVNIHRFGNQFSAQKDIRIEIIDHKPGVVVIITEFHVFIEGSSPIRIHSVTYFSAICLYFCWSS